MDKVYRPDIDGLRAIAVGAVTLNHFRPELLPSGFLGVDIFFVISGFVITQSLFANNQQGHKQALLLFYEKRLKRIVPALILNVFVVSLLCWLFQYDPVLSIKTGVASLCGASNLYLITKATDYFAQNTYSNFFLHTWSLGVEEQFYLFYPALFLTLGSRRSITNGYIFCVVLFCLSVASWILFNNWWESNNSLAYFSPLSRSWELFAGCLSFVVAFKFSSRCRTLEVLPITAFVVLMASTYVNANSSIQHLIVVISTSALLISSRNTIAEHFLGLPALRNAGKVSYSIYLWHWPAICLITNFGLESNSILTLLSIIIFLGIALSSYFLVEIPLRKSEWSDHKFKNIALGIVSSFIAITSILTLQKLDIQRLLFTGKRYDSSLYASTLLGGLDCGASPTYQFRFPMCSQKAILLKNEVNLVDSNSPDVWILGDSQAAHLAAAASMLSRLTSRNINIASVYGAPFPPVRYIDMKRGVQDSKKRYDLQNEIFKKIIKLARQDSIFIIYNSGSYNDVSNKTDLFVEKDWKTTSPNVRFKSQFYSQVLTLIKASKVKNLKILIIRPTPRFRNYSWTKCVQWYSLMDSLCNQKISKSSYSFQQGDSVLVQLEKLPGRIIKIVDSHSSLCVNTVCETKIGGSILYHDGVHLTPVGAQLLAREIHNKILESD